MNIQFVEHLIGILERSTLAELEYAEHGARVRLSRTSRRSAADTSCAPVAPLNDAPLPTRALSASTQPAAGHPSPAPQGQAVSAPLAGVLYCAPAPGQPPFVNVGDMVEPGQQLAIIEAMKMLNVVESEHMGRLVSVVAADGTAVEAGATLFVIEPVGDSDV
ncbi:conserved hypothetical protein [Cupriavidus necator]|uniref:Biotin carboxyl carrier protein of acetyl-CoA carboxylase n=1 Tax=Cupriavidus necator TaxID=106590 RepID=A0A1K0IDP0_CUPNE|nr:conserved hypothetical protein [Cupriavidus necator]